MTTRLELGAERPGLRLGFTLVELLVVMTIIGIILAFLLTAAMDARRRAEEDATQSLITKLEGGLNDRLDALMQNQPTPNYAQDTSSGLPRRTLRRRAPDAACRCRWPACRTPSAPGSCAQVIATFDYIKAELPDVFFVQQSKRVARIPSTSRANRPRPAGAPT